MLCNGKVRKQYVFVVSDIQCIYWCFLLFQNPFHLSGPFKSIKTIFNLYMFCKVCLQYEIAIQSWSRMMKSKIEFAKNKCLSTVWSTEKMPVA